MKIETRDNQGQVNGWLCPIWNVLDGPQVDQVYLTVIAPGMMKGPHLHLRRRGLFKVIFGKVRLVTQACKAGLSNVYYAMDMDVTTEPIHVAPGTPAALYNIGDAEAYVLNMPSPAWRPDDQDEHEVRDWNYTL